MHHLSGPLRLEDMSLSREMREREGRIYSDRDLGRSEDDWRQIDSVSHGHEYKIIACN